MQKKGFKIKCGDDVCDWWTFVQTVNEKIAEETSSDDKKLGYFFCKPQNEGEPIGVERFVSKVMFYLWNDVFKDGNTTDFNVSGNSNKQPSFDAFYNDDNTINIENVRKFLVNIVGENGLGKVNENGFKEFYKLREQQHGHEIEAVGRELRKMMPFIKSKSIQK